jgi:hypothetical protein
MVQVNPATAESVWSPGSDLAVRSNRNVTYMLSALGLLCLAGLLAVATTPTPTHPDPSTPAEFTLSNLARIDRKSSIKPSIYRFDRVSNSASDERRLPHVWDMVWSNAGWKPQKLMVDQLSSKVEYLELKERLLKTKLVPIQQRHIMKYMAMASVGGGWLAHGDTFPLNPFGNGKTLPNGGKMSVFDDKFPCLMSANAEEWLKMATSLVEHAEKYSEPSHWTEPKALDDLKVDVITVGETFNLKDAGAKDTEGEQSWTWNSNDCAATQHMRAVHFLVDFLEDLSQVADPADMVIKWLSMWLQACERNTAFTDKEGGRRTQEISSQMETASSSGDGVVVQATRYLRQALYRGETAVYSE